MKPTEFCYWLQGYFELREDASPALTANQTAVIIKHLQLVFKHEIDPSYANSAELTKIHNKPIGPPNQVISEGLIRC